MLFIFDLLPAGLFHLILMFGIAGSAFAEFAPGLSLIPVAYRVLFKMIAAGCLALGLIFVGVNIANESWTAKYHKAELDMKDLETKQAKLTGDLALAHTKKVEIVRVKGDTIVQKVPEYISVASDKQCVLPVGFLRFLNQTAQVSGATGGPDEKATAGPSVPRTGP